MRRIVWQPGWTHVAYSLVGAVKLDPGILRPEPWKEFQRNPGWAGIKVPFKDHSGDSESHISPKLVQMHANARGTDHNTEAVFRSR